MMVQVFGSVSLVTKARAAFRKNGPPLKALLRRRYPSFVYARGIGGRLAGPPPVFHFHEIEERNFDEKLRFLMDNGYRTVNCEEWLAARSRPETAGRLVLLTVDDGHISLYRQAFPLLQRHGCKAVSFVCPALVPESDDAGERHLCTWAEIEEMHGSGLVDVQSHSLSHDLIYTSSTLQGFLHPRFWSHYFGKRDTALVRDDGIDISFTCLRAYDRSPAEEYLGSPIFEHAPRTATDTRFVCAPEVSRSLRSFVAERGGAAFFEDPGWERQLRARLAERAIGEAGSQITGAEYQRQVESELRQAREAIERRLNGKAVRFYCAPWFEATQAILRSAARAGYVAAFMGSDVRSFADVECPAVQRLSSNYIFRLPGRGRRGLVRVCRDRL